MADQLSERDQRRVKTSAAQLLGLAFAMSQWSDFLVARWVLRGLPVWALLLALSLTRGRRGRLRLPVALTTFLAWCLASYAWSADPGNSLRRLVDLVAMLAIGWLTGQVLGARAARRTLALVAKWLLIAVVVSLMVAPAWATAPGSDGALGWHGPFPHKNGLGYLCAFAAITLWTAMPPGWPRRLWLGLDLVLLVGSQSASALAALVVAGVVMAWHTARSRRSFRGRLGVDAAAAAAGAVLGVVALFWPNVFFALLGRDGSLTGRRAIWAAVEHWIGMRPLIGYGFGGVWEDPAPVTLAIWRESRFDAFYAHNGYLDVLLQVGVIGLALVLVVLAGLLVAATRSGAPAGSWPLGVVVLLLLTAITESSPFTGNGLLLLGLLVGGLNSHFDTGAVAGLGAAGRAAVPSRVSPAELVIRP